MVAVVTCIMFSFFSPCYGESKNRLILSTMNWNPYYAEHLPDGGPVAEITKEAFRQVGYDVAIVFLPWKRALFMAKEGYYDGLLGAYYSEERSHHFSYTNKLTEAEVVLVSQKGKHITYKSLDDLKPYLIGVLRGGTVTQEFDTATYLTKVELTDHEQAIQMLIANRVDLVVLGKYHLLQYLKSTYSDWPDLIEIVNPPLKVNSLFNAISKQNPDHKSIVSDFDRGLKEIRVNGMFERIMTKHSTSEHR